MPEKNPRLGEASNVSALRVLLIFAVAILIVLGAIIVFTVTHRGTGSLPDYRNPKYVTVGSDAADEAALEKMQAAGVDLTKPARIMHYLYVPTERFAQLAAGELTEYTVQISKTSSSQPNQEWLVQATRTTVPSMDYFRESRTRFNNLAIIFGGDYAGWEVATTFAADAAGHPLSAYAGSYRGSVRGKPLSMDIVVQHNRLWIATHGWTESCWVARPGDGGMVIVQGGPGFNRRAWAVDTSWVLSIQRDGIQVKDPVLGGPTYVYYLRRESQKANLTLMWSNQPVHQSCLPITR